MNTYTKLAVSAAALVVVAVAGYNLLPRTGGFGGPVASPTPEPSPSPVAAATATPVPTTPLGPLAAGSHVIYENSYQPYRVTVPAGWAFDDVGFIAKGDYSQGNKGVAFTTWEITDIYTDACHWNGKLLTTSSRDALAAGLAAQTGLTSSRPSPATVGGLPATQVVLSVPSSFNPTTCDSGLLRLWPDPGPDVTGGRPIWPGQTATVFALEIAGKPEVVLLVTNEGSTAADKAELQAILASLQFQN